jgi:hypothetical protein
VSTCAPHECDGGIANELVKYLTKDWQVSSDGVKRVSPEVFAEVYAKLDGSRLRQSSQGLAHWAVPKDKSCPCCAFHSEREHWARVFIVNADQQASQAPSPDTPAFPEVPRDGPGTRTRSQELREAYDAKRDAEWRAISRHLYARPGMRAAGVVPSEVPTSRGTEAKTDTDLQLKLRGF